MSVIVNLLSALFLRDEPVTGEDKDAVMEICMEKISSDPVRRKKAMDAFGSLDVVREVLSKEFENPNESALECLYLHKIQTKITSLREELTHNLSCVSK